MNPTQNTISQPSTSPIVKSMNPRNIMKNTNQTLRNITANMRDVLLNNERMLQWFLIIAIIILIFLMIYYYRNEMTKNKRNTNKMINNLDSVSISLTNINLADAKYQHNLRDYYIMSSYNSCCNGRFNNDFVSLDALKQVIRRGARLLDFEVYSVDNKTVIAASYNNNFFQKGTYNSLPFSEVMNIIQNYGFSASTCPTYNDPLILHFRIKSKQSHVYEEMAKSLSSIFGNRRLPRKYNFESNGENIWAEPIENFVGKVILVCDKSSDVISGSKLDEIINMTSGSQFMRKLRNYDVQFAPSMDDLIEFNKKNVSISMPDLSNRNTNINAGLHFKYGCQMVCLNFQNVDSNLTYYLEQFNKYGSAFILKPEELRYVPVYADKPADQEPKLSYAPRQIEKPYFSHTL